MSQSIRLPRSVTVDGQPLLGSYNVETAEGIATMARLGMNVVLGGREHLDPSSPVGRACSEHGVHVIYHLTQHIYGKPRLADRITADQDEIPLFLHGAGTMPASGVIALDDERIHYGGFEHGRLIRCKRGYDGTNRAAHRGGTILFWPEECARDIEAVRTSPMLWGYYVLDDSPGDAISALRNLYRVAKRLDPKRIIAAGYGSAGSLCNFGRGVCDLMLIYWYPVFGSGRYDPLMTSHQVQWMVAAAREQVPGIPFAGVYQTFDAAYDRPENRGRGVPTPEQLRKQIEDYVREGACGLIAYLGGVPSLDGWLQRPTLQDVIRETHQGILEHGALRVPPEPSEMRAQRVFPIGGARRPRPIAGIPPAWYVILPFGPTGERGIRAVYPPEQHVDVQAVYEGAYGPVRWEVRRSFGGVVGLGELLGGQDLARRTTAYATCEVISPKTQTVELRYGSDDDMMVWVNGTLVVQRDYAGGLERDAERTTTVLRQGTTRILVKVHNRAGMWGFHLRLTDTSGKPPQGLQFRPLPH